MTKLQGFAACLAVIAVGCDSGSNVGEATCSACVGAAFTATDCEMFGALAGCATAQLRDSTACINECAFTDCDSPPMCTPREVPPDVPVDAWVDPRCGMPEDGIFSSCDLCAGDCDEFMYMGVTQYTCHCGAPCPCGLECGSVALPAGGTLGSVCGPPP